MDVYFGVCCLNRPFDDQSDPRIALESLAVLQLFDAAAAGLLTDWSSGMARFEIDRTRDPERRKQIIELLPPRSRVIDLDNALLSDADQLSNLGFGVADAVHLSAARRLSVDVFLTVDDKLLKRARRHAKILSFRVINPLLFVQELSDGNDR